MRGTSGRLSRVARFGGLSRVARFGRLSRVARFGRLTRCAPFAACAACAAAVLVPAGSVYAAVASSGTTTARAITGNPQGIKLAKKVMRSFAHIPVYKQTEQHFFQIRSDAKKGTFSYLFGQPQHSGYVWASEAETVAIHSNRVSWWLDALKPTSGGDSPVVVVVNRHGRYSAFGTPKHHSCFRRLASGSTLPYRYGGLGYSIGGRMRAPKYHGKTALLPYVYLWKSGQKATETDKIERQVDLVASGNVKIAAGKGSPAFGFAFANSYPTGAPGAPTVNLCKR